MSRRPYFKSGIQELEQLFVTSCQHPDILRQLQHELSFRNKPRAVTLKAKVDKLLLQSGGGQTASSRSGAPGGNTKRPEDTPKPSIPDRLAVDCPHCRAANFVTPIPDVTQYMSCSGCRQPYQAQFKNGVLRTTFGVNTAATPSGISQGWLVAIFIAILFLFLLLLN